MSKKNNKAAKATKNGSSENQELVILVSSTANGENVRATLSHKCTNICYKTRGDWHSDSYYSETLAELVAQGIYKPANKRARELYNKFYGVTDEAPAAEPETAPEEAPEAEPEQEEVEAVETAPEEAPEVEPEQEEVEAVETAPVEAPEELETEHAAEGETEEEPEAAPEAEPAAEKQEEEEQAADELPVLDSKIPAGAAWPNPSKKELTDEEKPAAIRKLLSLFVSNDAQRYVLGGVHHTVKDGREDYVATDGRKLALLRRKAPAGMEPVTETVTAKGVQVSGNYPNYEQVIPTRWVSEKRVSLAKFRFLEKLKRYVVATVPHTARVGSWGDIPESAKNAETGTYADSKLNHVYAESPTGPMLLDAEYVGLFVKALAGFSKNFGFTSEVMMGVTSQDQPLMLRAVAGEYTLTYVVMPRKADFKPHDGDVFLDWGEVSKEKAKAPAKTKGADKSKGETNNEAPAARPAAVALEDVKMPDGKWTNLYVPAGTDTAVGIPADYSPSEGDKLIRQYKGQIVVADVLERGFAWNGKVWPTLTHISWEVCPYHMAGTTFFGVPAKKRMAK